MFDKQIIKYLKGEFLKMGKTVSILLVLVCFFMNLASCDTTEPTYNKISLSVEESLDGKI